MHCSWHTVELLYVISVFASLITLTFSCLLKGLCLASMFFATFWRTTFEQTLRLPVYFPGQRNPYKMWTFKEFAPWGRILFAPRGSNSHREANSFLLSPIEAKLGRSKIAVPEGVSIYPTRN